MQQTNVLEYLENIVTKVPDKIAYRDENGGLTFSEVYSAARGIGSMIADKGLYNEPVVIYMKKCPEAIASFFGAVYAGCFYVAIDDEMPRPRIELIFETLKPKFMICDEKNKDKASEFDFDGEIVMYDEAAAYKHNDEKLAEIRDRQLDTDPIYIVFTSGSTGVPKGIVACHRSVIDYIENLSEVLELNENTVFGNQSPFYFDACLKELYPTIKFGAQTVIVPKQMFSFPIKMVEFLNEYKINTICWVASAIAFISSVRTFDKMIPEYLTTVAFGSEVLPIKQFNRWRTALPNCKFINLYGPTEATGMSCYYKVNREFNEGDVIPIGRAFHNTEIILLDDDNKRARDGEPGEICIRGTALTMGYYNNWEKTGEVFVQNPLNTRYPELIYRTGDLGKLNAFGEIEFISRKDYQIKHMGHRIELGEIEANVNALDGVYASCAVYNREKDRIGLFFTGSFDEKELTNILRDKLPRYMLPHKVYKLEDMPHTPNGKIDRKLLASKNA